MIRLAGPEDDGALQRLAGQPMEGSISLAFTASPSFFGALSVYGHDSKVLVAEEKGRIVAVGVLAKRRVYVEGTPTEIGYLGGLRIESSSRNGLVLGRGYERFKLLQEKEWRLPFYLTSIMEDNSRALAVLTSGRAGLPIYSEVGRYRTVVIPLRRLKSKNVPPGLCLSGDEIGWDRILQFLQESGKRKLFSPVFDESLFDGTQVYRSIRLSDFLVAVEGGEVLGLMALWDQRAFRQVRVVRYKWSMDFFRRAARVFSPFSALSRLPAPGSDIALLYAACIAVRGDNPETFRCLLDNTAEMARARAGDFLAVGLFEGDPLLPVPLSLSSTVLRSRIFAVHWPGESSTTLLPIEGMKYLELGSL